MSRHHKSINVERIISTTSEPYSWIAFLVANMLGSALHCCLKVSSGLLVWLAFVLTCSFGATFGDLLAKTYEKRGT